MPRCCSSLQALLTFATLWTTSELWSWPGLNCTVSALSSAPEAPKCTRSLRRSVPNNVFMLKSYSQRTPSCPFTPDRCTAASPGRALSSSVDSASSSLSARLVLALSLSRDHVTTSHVAAASLCPRLQWRPPWRKIVALRPDTLLFQPRH